jgi:hypothetical protein
MVQYTLDSIVKQALLLKRYPLAYYIDFLVYAKYCLAELALDDLKNVRTKLLTVNDYFAVDLPNDFLDETKVGVMVGQQIRPLVPDNSINSLNNYDSNFAITTYASEQQNDNDEELFYYFNSWMNGLYLTTFWNSYGEPLGRQFGFSGGYSDTYKVVRERNQIQLNEAIGVDTIVLEYISDGTDADSATQITPYAVATIRAYIDWQHKANNRTYNDGQRELAKQEYMRERKILRARMSGLTLTTLKRIVAKSTYAAPKS